MGIGAITVDPATVVAAPSSLLLTLPTQDDYRATNHGPLTTVTLETLRGLLWGNGQDQLRHIVTNVLKTGILAPEDAPTATPTGARATATLNLDVSVDGAYNPVNGDAIYIGPNFIQFLTTIPTVIYSSISAVLIGGTASVTLDNLRALVEDGVGSGVTYVRGNASTPLTSTISVTGKTATTLAMRALAYGTLGNSILGYLLSPPTSWSDCSFGSQGATIGTLGYFTGGGAGSGTAPEAGYYDGWAYNYLRTEDQAYSGLSPRVSADMGIDMNVTVASMVSPDDPDDDIDFIRIWRPIASALAKQRVKDVDEDTASTTDDVSNDELDDRESFDESLYAVYAGGYPPRARCVAPYEGRVFAAGARLSADYSAGTASVTNDSNEVTLTGAYPTVEWIGRTFRVSGESLSYNIVRVTSSTKKLYLGTNYEGTTNGTRTYTVKDERNPYLNRYTEPLLPNAWPTAYELKGVTSPAADGVMAVVPGFGHLIELTPTGLWRITGDSLETFAPHHESEVAGCVGPMAALMVEGSLFWLGSDGVYAWPGGGDPINMTLPPAQGGEVSGIQGTINRLNQRQLSDVVSCYDPEERIIRWAVPLDDEVTNRHMVILDLQTSTFSTDECEDVTALARVVDGGGESHILTGSVHGNICELNVGESDGAYGFEPVQAVDGSCTSLSLTGLAGLPTSGDGLSGLPVYMIDASGNFTRTTVATNTATAIVPTSFITPPANTTQIVIGAILFDMMTGRWHGGDLRDQKTIPTLTVGFSPQTRGQMWVASAVDQGTPGLSVSRDDEIDMTDSTGRSVVHLGQHGYLHKQRIVALAPHFTPNFHALEYEMVWRK